MKNEAQAQAPPRLSVAVTPAAPENIGAISFRLLSERDLDGVEGMAR
ncbi:MAG: hypothetical protein LBU46_00625 [Candidatus Accumulibacter sp.]|jgi:hypothetical protein|nr:hypothetical protein [Accumulibacter sp.]